MNQKRKDIHFIIYQVALVMLIAGLPNSKFIITISQFLLLTNWIAENHFKTKIKKLKTTPAIWIFSSIYIVHLLGLINTSDIGYALKDLRIKLPILLIPVIIGTSRPLTPKQLKTILLFFIASVAFKTLDATAVFCGIIPYPVEDIRDITRNISHIRFALFIVFSIFILIYYFFHQETKKIAEKIIYGITIVWFFVFLFILKAFTGFVMLFIVAFCISVWKIRYIHHLILRIFLYVMVITGVLLTLSYITKSIAKFYPANDTINFEELDTYTANGNRYNHKRNDKSLENAHYAGLYICEKELESEWNKRSEIYYDSLDLDGNKVKYTLMRYLTSKGYRKDSAGVWKLNQQDIKNIENGIANYIFYEKSGLEPRIYQIIWEIDYYLKGGNPDGHSVTQRFEYLKTGYSILQDHFWFGTGTGDIKKEFKQQYKEDNSPLSKEHRRRTHNQYVTFFITFGVFGFLWILFAMFAPIYLQRKRAGTLFFVTFALIIFISMLSEDTLETQAGVTFFTFFYSLLLFGIQK